jgi:putative peptidoglycan lipid II flippase
VLVKVLVPSFYARADTKTPVYAAFAALAVFVALNILFLDRFGVVGVAAASAIGAWLNAAVLYAVLSARDHYRAPIRLLGRIARQIVAAAAMGAALWFARDLLTGYYAAGIFERLFALAVLVACSAIVYFGVAFAIGAVDRDRLLQLTRKKAAE